MEGIFMCDSTIFDVFTFSFTRGDPKTAFKDPLSCVLTESEARKIFGDADPMGEMLGLWTVTGIIEDMQNFHIDIKWLFTFNYGFQEGKWMNQYAG